MRDNIYDAGLVDIGTVDVNQDLPQRERCTEFKRQIKDMGRYKGETLPSRLYTRTTGQT